MAIEAAEPAAQIAGARCPAAVPAHPVRSPVLRALLLLLAVLSLGLAVLGAILPGLPCAEFVLLAAWAGARSSPRLHGWLHRHPLFGPVLHNWHHGRRVSRRAKWAASASMLVCALLLCVGVPHLWLVLPALGCMAGVQIWLWRRPEPA
jgi:uncharacterized membrane protein YbaN (DUF454 family)